MKTTILNLFVMSLVLSLTACSDSDREVFDPEVSNKAFTGALSDFPAETGTIYGTWMETRETKIANSNVSARRFFFVSKTQFTVGQKCFNGVRSKFVRAQTDVEFVDQTVLVKDDVLAQNTEVFPDMSCDLVVSQGYYGINYDALDQLQILVPDTGEVIRAVRYIAPLNTPSGN